MLGGSNTKDMKKDIIALRKAKIIYDTKLNELKKKQEMYVNLKQG